MSNINIDNICVCCGSEKVNANDEVCENCKKILNTPSPVINPATIRKSVRVLGENLIVNNAIGILEGLTENLKNRCCAYSRVEALTPDTIDNISECLIALEQLKTLYGIENLVDEKVKNKIHHLTYTLKKYN